MISPPELLNESHLLDSFDCNKPSLNDWLKKRARKAQRVGGSARTYVLCAENGQVVGYYSLATGSINHSGVVGKVKRNMPDPIPVIILARLAIDHSMTGQGLGQGLLRDALFRIASAAEVIGVRAILVHAIDDHARRFYTKHGFYESPIDDRTLMITVEEVVRVLNH